MSNYQIQSAQLKTSLGLSLQPIAVAFCDELPANIANFDGVVPAGCAFWQKAATRTFATTASDHALCSIGIHTHNLAGAPAAQQTELQSTLQAMIGLDYVRADEIASIPVLRRAVKYALYGPLSDFPVAPEVALLFADAQQGLVLSEATQRVDGDIPLAMGRPACAVIPQVVNQDRAAMSLGCCGARAYLDVLTDGVALWALPGTKLDDYCAAIEKLANANKTLLAFHERRRTDIESGDRPSVQVSLERLGA